MRRALNRFALRRSTRLKDDVALAQHSRVGRRIGMRLARARHEEHGRDSPSNGTHGGANARRRHTIPARREPSTSHMR